MMKTVTLLLASILIAILLYKLDSQSEMMERKDNAIISCDRQITEYKNENERLKEVLRQ